MYVYICVYIYIYIYIEYEKNDFAKVSTNLVRYGWSI